MNQIEKLIEICNDFKQRKFNTADFQKRIETVYLPDRCKNTLEKEQHNAFNKLEEILYCYTDSKRKYADEVADTLVRAAMIEKKNYEGEKEE